MRLIFIGDVVGKTGRNAVAEELPRLRERYEPDFVVLNGENAASGVGITEKIYEQFRDAGADVVTLGNHAWDQREALVFIERAPNLLRPLNYPEGTPGKGVGLFPAANGKQVLVINAMGRVFMNPLDNPFAAIDKELNMCPLGEACDAAIIDFHGEATSEKMAMGHYVDGRASLLVGTHTHVPTADHQVLMGGTAYQTDTGMCGDFDSVIGVDKEEPLSRFLTGINRARFSPATGEPTICGLAVETDDATGLAAKVAPIRIGGRLEPVLPPFWEN
ncbi:MAG: TIGR00282 family metallophosphoesterase [Hyphomicrobiales bacterium]